MDGVPGITPLLLQRIVQHSGAVRDGLGGQFDPLLRGVAIGGLAAALGWLGQHPLARGSRVRRLSMSSDPVSYVS